MSTSSPSNPLWDSVKKKASVVGHKASLAAQRGRIKADLLLLDQKIKGRKQQFGVELYDFLVPFAEKDDMFIIESDSLEAIQGPFIQCFKDNKATSGKKAIKENALAAVGEKRALAFPVPAETVAGKLKNAGKSAAMTGQEAGIKTKMAMMERTMKTNKQQFGVEVYHLLVKKEDEEKWLPSDRDVRFFYDQARRDVEKLEQDWKTREADLAVLGSETSG